LTKTSRKRWSKINDYLGKVTTTVDSIRYGNLSTKIDEIESPTYQNVTDSINRMVETLNDREKMIIEYQTELMRQNTLLESVINTLSDGILIINERFEILRATPKVLKWFGIKGKDIIGKNIFQFVQPANDDNFVTGDLYSIEATIKHCPSKNFMISSQPLQSLEKRRFVLVIKDITTEKEMATIKEEFVATLTHDLKVPIVAAANMIDLLLAEKFGEVSDKQKVALENMKSSNNSLLELVKIILETYKLKGTGIQLYKEDVNLDNFIGSIVDEMRPTVTKAKLDIRFTPKNENLTVFIDPVQMKRVVKNLISNAIDHSNTKKGIDVEIGTSGKYTTIAIVDYGHGISKEEVKLIFNKYYSAARKLRKVGTGLGLYLSQQIAMAHGGEIVVTSEKNVRTEFCIKIPQIK
jgi:PAS domain S-box-containing protein